MKENNISNLKLGDKVEFALDVAPGQVFEGSVRSIGYGVSMGTSNRGDLPSISGSSGWLRDPQRFPVIITFDNSSIEDMIRIGGQVDVVAYTGDSGLLHTLARWRIRLNSLAFLLPVLSLGFLAPDKKAPSLTEGLAFILTIGIAVASGLLIGYFANRPIILFLVMGLVLLHIFYSRHPLMNPLLKTWMIIALLLLPMMNLLYPGLSLGVAYTLIFGVAGTVILIWIVFALIPDKMELSENQKEGPEKALATPVPTKEERFRAAIESTLVVMPVLIIFYTFQWAGSLLILIFVGIFSMQPGMASFKVGKAMIIGNLIGGLISIAVYNLLVVTPYWNMMVILILCVALYCGYQFFSGKKASPLFNMALSTFMLILGSVISATDVDPGAKLWTRLLQMAVAVTYVVVAFQFIEKWKKYRKRKKDILNQTSG
jgi:hypothetical protein